MTDRPIIFSAPMVRALLDGRKTQTRRILTPQMLRFFDGQGGSWRPDKALLEHALTDVHNVRNIEGDIWTWSGRAFDYQAPAERTTWFAHLHFTIGDRLYVRDSWAPLAYSRELGGSRACKIGEADFAMMFDGHHQHKNGRSQPGLKEYAAGAFDGVKWAPSIHMPRWASRLTLIVTGVKVERLQDISYDDCVSEGIEQRWTCLNPATGSYAHDNDVQDNFCTLWKSINGAESWQANPWVVAVSFTVHHCNIDQMQEAA